MLLRQGLDQRPHMEVVILKSKNLGAPAKQTEASLGAWKRFRLETPEERAESRGRWAASFPFQLELFSPKLLRKPDKQLQE